MPMLPKEIVDVHQLLMKGGDLEDYLAKQVSLEASLPYCLHLQHQHMGKQV